MRRLLCCLPLALIACKAPAADAPKPAPSTAAATSAAPKSATPAPAANNATLAAGDPTPQVTLTLEDGRAVSLADLGDDLVFVYFYPKDDTPGCTVEAKGLRDNYEALTKAGVKVFGVSMQDAASHKAFISAYQLPFSLAVDDGSVAKAFDVPVRGEYAARHSFLMKGGQVVKVWRQVNPAAHAAEVLAAAEAAGKSAG